MAQARDTGPRRAGGAANGGTRPRPTIGRGAQAPHQRPPAPAPERATRGKAPTRARVGQPDRAGRQRRQGGRGRGEGLRGGGRAGGRAARTNHRGKPEAHFRFSGMKKSPPKAGRAPYLDTLVIAGRRFRTSKNTIKSALQAVLRLDRQINWVYTVVTTQTAYTQNLI